ncbi:MAG: hypothetical protein ACOX3R_08470 [Desulfitobacteriia bacterium]|jgi:hypothetical protein
MIVMMDNIYLDYYEYLLKISWPALSGLFLIYLFLGIRLLRAIKAHVTTPEHLFGQQIVLFLRSVLIIVVLAIYTHFFVLNYGDWLEKPALSRGQIESLELRPGYWRDDYFLTLICGEEKLNVRIDHHTFLALKAEDQIEIAYLPRKKAVFWCLLLT